LVAAAARSQPVGIIGYRAMRTGKKLQFFLHFFEMAKKPGELVEQSAGIIK
jgi:hypothetical protein